MVECRSPWEVCPEHLVPKSISNADQRHLLLHLGICSFLIQFHLQHPTPPHPLTLPTSISHAFNSTGGVLDFSVFVVCAFPYMKACLSKQRHHKLQQHTWLLLSGLLIYCCGGENAKSMQNQSFHIYVIHITFALWELSILLLCVCAIALGIGTRILHDEYSPVTCSCCAVIENMICACRENCSSPTCLLWYSLVCFCFVVHRQRCRKYEAVISHLAQCAFLAGLEYAICDVYLLWKHARITHHLLSNKYRWLITLSEPNIPFNKVIWMLLK